MKRQYSAHWLDRVSEILSSSSGDLRELASIAGIDPKYMYRNQSLAGCDLRGQDLRGIDLTGCEITKAQIDNATKIDAEYDPRIYPESEYVHFQITRSLNKLVLDYSSSHGYKYDAWAYKALFDKGLSQFYKNRWKFYEDTIRSNAYFFDLVNYRSKSNLLEKTMQIHNHQKLPIDNKIPVTDRESIGWIMLVGALSKKIRYNSRKDHSTITPNSLFQRKDARFIL